MDINSFLQKLKDEDLIQRNANNPSIEFGLNKKTYLGATFLPVVSTGIKGNLFEEIIYNDTSTIAFDGTRFSAIPMQKGGRGRKILVELGVNDKGFYFEGPDFEAFQDYLNRDLEVKAMATLFKWVDVHLNQPLIEIIEKQRWEAIADARVLRRGDNDFNDYSNFPNPAGHRVDVPSGTDATPQGWYDPNHDPFDDIMAMTSTINAAGYHPTHIVTSPRIKTLLMNHPKVRSQLLNYSNLTSLEALNNRLIADNLPSIQVYNTMYKDHDGIEKPFLRDTAFVMLSTDASSPELIDSSDSLDPTSLGYVGMGRTAGRLENGRTISLKVNTPETGEIKNPNISGEATQYTYPVIYQPRAIGVLNILKQA